MPMWFFEILPGSFFNQKHVNHVLPDSSSTERRIWGMLHNCFQIHSTRFFDEIPVEGIVLVRIGSRSGRPDVPSQEVGELVDTSGGRHFDINDVSEDGNGLWNRYSG